MSKVYWGIGVAALLILLAWTYYGLSTLAEYRDAHEDQQHEAANQPEQPAEEQRCAVTVLERGFLCRAYVPAHPTEPNKREQYDLEAQQHMAEWALAILFVSVAGAFISVIGVLVVGFTLRETREMTRATREIGERQSRAYLDVVGAKINWHDPINCRVEIDIANVGQTRAKNIHAKLVFRVTDAHPQDATGPVPVLYLNTHEPRLTDALPKDGRDTLFFYDIAANFKEQLQPIDKYSKFGCQPEVQVYGRIFFEDVFDQEDFLPISLFLQWLEFGETTPMLGIHWRKVIDRRRFPESADEK